MNKPTNLFYDDTGATTLEFTVIVPFFILLLVFFTDVSVIYLTQSEMYNGVRDISRRMSTDELTTDDQVRDYVASHLFLGNRTYSVQADFGTEMSVAISVPIREAAIFGFFLSQILGRELSVSSTLRRELLS